MRKIDLKRELAHLYNPSPHKVAIVDVPPLNFLMIDGAGDPNLSPAYHQAIEALFSLSYTLKFMAKKGKGVDYGVMPLEGLWWTDDPTQWSNKSLWQWTAMIMQPEWVTPDMVAEALRVVKEKKGLTALDQVRFECYHEGLAAQIMHLGPYDAEGPTIAKLHDFIRESGHELRGKHHEIYLSDPQRSAPERLKTVLRQPMGGPLRT
ncbi:MAG: GyrI-like domain-containing protein [Calditrichaeota bacterium]|nr:GyrI-like domain-containing protein [Calditrichota bacterium]